MKKTIKSDESEFEFKAQNLQSITEKSRKTSLKLTWCFSAALIILTLLNSACVNQKLLANKNKTANAAEIVLSEYEKDLQSMKTADFNYIFAFRRKDGNVFDSDDKKYLRANTPPGTNRFVSTDEGRAFIAGSTYKFSPENISALQNRFMVENYSKPEQPSKPEDVNANK